jgi:hypothetical protein
MNDFEKEEFQKDFLNRVLAGKSKGAVYNSSEVEIMGDEELNVVALSAAGNDTDRWVSLETIAIIRAERIKRGILLPNGKRVIKEAINE